MSSLNGGEQTQLGWQSAERRGEERRGEESTTTLHLAATTRSKVGSVGRHSIAPARTREAPLNVSECRCEGCAVDTRSHPRELARLAHGRDHRRRPLTPPPPPPPPPPAVCRSDAGIRTVDDIGKKWDLASTTMKMLGVKMGPRWRIHGMARRCQSDAEQP